jgi:hypothetical protein
MARERSDAVVSLRIKHISLGLAKVDEDPRNHEARSDSRERGIEIVGVCITRECWFACNEELRGRLA